MSKFLKAIMSVLLCLLIWVQNGMLFLNVFGFKIGQLLKHSHTVIYVLKNCFEPTQEAIFTTENVAAREIPPSAEAKDHSSEKHGVSLGD